MHGTIGARVSEEVVDFLHLVAVWVCLALPVAAFVDAVVVWLTARGFWTAEGLLAGTIPVVLLEVTDSRPRLALAFAFFVVYEVLGLVFVFPLAALVPGDLGQVVGLGLGLVGALAVVAVLARGGDLLGPARAALERLLPPPAGSE